MSMNTIYKYALGVQGLQDIWMPIDAEIIAVDTQDGNPCLWARVNPDAPTECREIVTHGTGHDVPATTGRHIGTYQMDGGALVFHVFESSEGVT